MHVFTALRSEKIESLATKCFDRQVLAGRWAGPALPGGGSSTLAGQKMDGNGRECYVDVMATLISCRAFCYGISALVPKDTSVSYTL
jgi:hypothetical protein